MSVMDSSKCVVHCVLCLICFHLALSANHKQFKTAEERNAYLYNHSYGCTNLKELRARELHDHTEHIPKCGCGFYGVRMFDNDPRQDLYNVTITTAKGRIQRFECKQCDLCVGLKVENVCRPKQNTKCSDVCEDPCDTYISVLKICGRDKNKCPEKPTTTATIDEPVTSAEQPIPSPTTHPVSPIRKLGHREEPEVDNYYLSWLIVAAVVITASVIAVILIIIVVLCNQNRMHKNSNGGSNNTSSNSLLPSTPQIPTGAGEPV